MEGKEVIKGYLNFLRAIYQTHHDNHWKCQGNDFYGNHLMFKKLYENTLEHVDEVGEKLIGVYKGKDIISTDPESIGKIVEQYQAEKYGNDCVRSSLEIENAFLKLSKDVYDKLDQEDSLTLGVDDMIMSISNDHEVHVYLLESAENN